jgi:hypothetical protein
MRLPSFRGIAPWVVVATLIAAGAAAAAGYALTAPKRYRATAQLLVTPVPAGDTTFTGIDVLRDTGGRHTAAASAAALVKAPLVADAVRAQLALHRSRDALLGSLHVSVPASSNVVDVTAEDTSPDGAARIANAFADTLVNQRSATFQSEVASAVRRYSQLLAQMPPAQRTGATGTDLAERLATLQSLQGQQDPTIRHAGQATAPTSSSWPHTARLVALGAAIGAAAGVVAALGLVLLQRSGRVRTRAEYDRTMSERALEQLAERLEARLAARESALVARERDLQAKIDELRGLQAALPEAERALRERERHLDEREAALAAAPDPGELTQRAQDLAERVAAVTKREVEVAKRAAAIAVRERELEEAPPPPPAPEPVPAPVALAAAAGAGGETPGTYNLLTLERLVEERSAEFPDRAEEWLSYLFFLRDYAAPDGTVPAGFDWLIQDTFSDLVA